MTNTHVPLHRLREIAVMSFTDPRTVKRFLRGEQVKPGCADRIARAVALLEGKVGTEAP